MRSFRSTLARDVLLGVWFVLVGWAFWGPYGGLPPRDATPYGLFLTASLAAFALRLVRRQTAARGGGAEEAQHG
jgi:hypothetical protein